MPELKQSINLSENDLIEYCNENEIDSNKIWDDYKMIQRALSHHNSNSKEIRKQLVSNEVKRWQKHSLDCGNDETQSLVLLTFICELRVS